MSSQATGFSFKRAYVVSIALHFVMAACIFAMPQTSRLEDARVKPLERVRVATIAIVFRPRRTSVHGTTHQHARAHVVAAIPRVESRTKARNVSQVTQPRVARVAAPEPPIAVPDTYARPHELTARNRATVRVAVENRTVATSAPVAAPAVPAQSEAAPAVGATTLPAAGAPAGTTVSVAPTSANTVDVPNGGWGQKFVKPLVADDDALASLRANAHSGGTVTIEVDESGRATRVTFAKSLASDVRADLEKRFLAMHYVPAECNGLRCTGTLELSL